VPVTGITVVAGRYDICEPENTTSAVRCRDAAARLRQCELHCAGLSDQPTTSGVHTPVHDGTVTSTPCAGEEDWWWTWCGCIRTARRSTRAGHSIRASDQSRKWRLRDATTCRNYPCLRYGSNILPTTTLQTAGYLIRGTQPDERRVDGPAALSGVYSAAYRWLHAGLNPFHKRWHNCS
jgi:hypothetical protein